MCPPNPCTCRLRKTKVTGLQRTLLALGTRLARLRVMGKGVGSGRGRVDDLVPERTAPQLIHSVTDAPVLLDVKRDYSDLVSSLITGPYPCRAVESTWVLRYVWTHE